MHTGIIIVVVILTFLYIKIDYIEDKIDELLKDKENDKRRN